MTCFTCEKPVESLSTAQLCQNGFGLCPFYHEEVKVGGSNWPEDVCNPCSGADAIEVKVCNECLESLKKGI
ncbi:MAG: hypothetical protein ACFFDT_34955 [Candidatus Hodarchaeota archaeon]